MSRLHPRLGSPRDQGPAKSTWTECRRDQPAPDPALPAAQSWVLTSAATVLGGCAKTWASRATPGCCIHLPRTGPGLPPKPPCRSWPPRGNPSRHLALFLPVLPLPHPAPATPHPHPPLRPTQPSCYTCFWTWPRKREPRTYSLPRELGKYFQLAIPSRESRCHHGVSSRGRRVYLLVAIFLLLLMSGPRAPPPTSGSGQRVQAGQGLPVPRGCFVPGQWPFPGAGAVPPQS